MQPVQHVEVSEPPAADAGLRRAARVLTLLLWLSGIWGAAAMALLAYAAATHATLSGNEMHLIGVCWKVCVGVDPAVLRVTTESSGTDAALPRIALQLVSAAASAGLWYWLRGLVVRPLQTGRPTRP